MIKRYILFAGDNYYPSGGALDMKSQYESLEEAMVRGEKYMDDEEHDWAHILDSETGFVWYYRVHEMRWEA